MATIPTATALWSLPDQMQMQSSAMTESRWSQVDKPEYGGGPWQVVGDDSQMVYVILQPGESVMAEPGGMLTSSPLVKASVDMGGCLLALKRCLCAGESFFRVHWTNTDTVQQSVSIGPPFAAKMVPVNLDQESGLNLKAKAWVASPGKNTEFDVVAASPMVCCCAGQGCCISTIKGSGTTFLGLGGTVIERELKAGEMIITDQPSVVAWGKDVKIDTRPVGDCMTMCCGGMGCFNVTLTGPGKVYLQSMSIEKSAASYKLLLMKGKQVA